MTPKYWPRRGGPAARPRLAAERLEDRRTPAVAVWDGGATTDAWSDPANWNIGGADGVPSFLDDVVFDGTSDDPARVDQETLVQSLAIRAGYDGTVTVAGTALVVTGDLTVAAGTLAHAGAFLSVGGNLTVSGGTLAYTGTDFVVTGDWTVAPAAVFAHDSSTPVTFNRDGGAQILNSGGTDANHDFAAVRQLGTGTLQLAGHDLAVTGRLEVEGGVVDDKSAGGTFDAAGRAVTVGGTLAVRNDSTYQGGAAAQTFGGLALDGGTVSGGNLVVTGEVTVTGGTLAPGTAAPGVLAAGGLTLAAAATVAIELGGTAAGQFDRLDVTGAVSLGGATLTVAPAGGFVPAAGDRFVLVRNDGAEAVQGTFAGLPEGAALTVGGRDFRVTYAGGDGNDVELVPPSSPPPGGVTPFAVGADRGGSRVEFFNADGTSRFGADAFAGFTGGVRTAAADFTGDGVADLVVGSGPGMATRVRVLDGKSQAELFAVAPFEASYTGGVYVAAGDLTGDGVAELVVTPDEGGGPRCRVFTGTKFSQLADFFGIDDPNFRGGARAAIGDINGDTVGDLVVAAGVGGGPRVAGYDGRTVRFDQTPRRVFGDFFAFEETLRNGVFLAAGDLNGDGFVDVIAGGGPGGGPRVFALSGKGLVTGNQEVRLANFFSGDEAGRGGIRVAVKNLDGDNVADLVVGAGTGSRVTAYAGKSIEPDGGPPELQSFDAFPGFTGGVFVG